MLGYSDFNPDIAAWDVSSVTDIYHMLDGNDGFNRNLCAWGRKLPSDVYVKDAFRGATQCPLRDDPNLLVNPSGPFCHACVEA